MKIFRICKFLPTKLCFLRIKPHYLFICSKIVAYWWGVTYNDVVPECYIITMDGLESEHFADVAPYIFEDLGRAYAVVKKQYRNTDLKKKCYRTQPRRNTFLRFCLSEIHLAHVGMYRVYAQWSNSNQKGSTN